MFFSFAFCTFFKIFHVRLGKKSKSVSFSRVYVCVKARLTLVRFFLLFFMHISLRSIFGLKSHTIVVCWMGCLGLPWCRELQLGRGSRGCASRPHIQSRGIFKATRLSHLSIQNRTFFKATSQRMIKVISNQFLSCSLRDFRISISMGSPGVWRRKGRSQGRKDKDSLHCEVLKVNCKL